MDASSETSPSWFPRAMIPQVGASLARDKNVGKAGRVCRFSARRLGLVVMVLGLMVLPMVGLPLYAGSSQAVAMVTAGGAEPGKHIAASDCVECHGVEPRFSHPTNKVPTFEVPAGLALDKGMVTCTTCHLDTAREHTAAQRNKGAMLRSDTLTGQAWCGQCHQNGELTRQGQHPGAVSRAHITGSFRPGANGSAVTVAATFAETSRSCLGCHDGTISTDGFPRSDAGAAGYALHAVDAVYGNNGFRRGNRDRNLVDKSALDGRIQLINDRVACTSCHSLYSPEKKLLVMSNQDSKLCISCHAMQ